MDAYEKEQMVHDFIEEQGIGVAFPHTDLDIMVALVNFGRTVLDDAEEAEGIIARGKIRRMNNVSVTVKWDISSEFRLRAWLAKMLIRLAVIALGCDIAFEQETDNATPTAV